MRACEKTESDISIAKEGGVRCSWCQKVGNGMSDRSDRSTTRICPTTNDSSQRKIGEGGEDDRGDLMEREGPLGRGEEAETDAMMTRGRGRVEAGPARGGMSKWADRESYL